MNYTGTPRGFGATLPIGRLSGAHHEATPSGEITVAYKVEDMSYAIVNTGSIPAGHLLPPPRLALDVGDQQHVGQGARPDA